MSSTAAARSTAGVAAATNMRAATAASMPTAASFRRSRVGRSRERARKNNCDDPNPEF
jgi:hypothetical protein